MPSLDAPGHYERAKSTTAGRADDFLRSIQPSDSVEETGSVDCSIGHVMLVNITRDWLADYVTSEGDAWLSMTGNFETGWYIIRTDSNGLIWGIGYGLDCVFNEEAARADFAEADNAYGQWLDTDESGMYVGDNEV